MKKLLSSSFIALAMMSSVASASVFDEFKADLKQLVSTFPAHEADGYRDTGCDIDAQVAVTNAAGEVLYYNNPTCPNVGGSSFDLSGLAAPPASVDDGGDEGEDGGDEGEGGDEGGDVDAGCGDSKGK